MKVENKHYRTIWQSQNKKNTVQIIDQRLLPHEFKIIDLITYRDAIEAISDMAVRVAPLIGETAVNSIEASLMPASSASLSVCPA